MNNESKQLLNSILERLDNIERRLSNLELVHQPIQPFDRSKDYSYDFALDLQKLITTDGTTFARKE